MKGFKAVMRRVLGLLELATVPFMFRAIQRIGVVLYGANLVFLTFLVTTTLVIVMALLGVLGADNLFGLKLTSTNEKTGTTPGQSDTSKSSQEEIQSTQPNTKAVDPARSLERMEQKFRKWKRNNPELDFMSVILSQMHMLKENRKVFEEVTRDSKCGQRGEESRKVFENTVEEIRQNFSDIYNLLLIVGVKNGGAKKAHVNVNALTREINSNFTKLQKLRELNEQIILFVNEVEGRYENVPIDSEIAVLKQLNTERCGSDVSERQKVVYGPYRIRLSSDKLSKASSSKRSK